MTPLEVKAIETAQDVVLPWGVYRGKTLDQVKSSYLRTLAMNCHDPIISNHADVLWNWREEMDEHF